MERNKVVRGICFIAILLCISLSANAELRFHRIFSDHMVLQRGQPVNVFGEAIPGEHLSVTFSGVTIQTVADQNKIWSVTFPAQEANASGQTITVSGKTTVQLQDILIGDVWLCSGQSNMEMSLGGCNDSVSVVNANFPAIRFVRVPYICKESPQQGVDTEKLEWTVCSPRTAAGCSAVGFYFARRISTEIGVPLGVLISSVGGTNIEKWMPQSSFSNNPNLYEYNQMIETWMKEYHEDLIEFQTPMIKWMKAMNKAVKERQKVPPMPYVPLHPSLPGSRYGGGQFSHLYNGMIAPLFSFKIKGALWYQGENNGSEERSYVEKKREMIAAWRKEWGYEFPFYFVQLSNWLKPSKEPDEAQKGWQYCRSGQLTCVREIPNTGMAVTYDIGDAEDIHPKNKFDVGERLALWALAHDYGHKIVYSGPLFKSAIQEGGRMRVLFEHVGSGLMIGCKKGIVPAAENANDRLKRFAIAGEDKLWYWADAVIQDDCVIVSSPKVSKPVAVRYAFSMNPEGANLYNKEGLPASPFRSDTW